MNITSDQIRAARALLRIEQVELAHMAHVSTTTIRRVESAGGADLVAAMTVNEIRQALEQAGAEFIADGVRRRPSSQPNHDTLYRDLRRIAERSAALLADTPALTDSDLYGDDGLPR